MTFALSLLVGLLALTFCTRRALVSRSLRVQVPMNVQHVNNGDAARLPLEQESPGSIPGGATWRESESAPFGDDSLTGADFHWWKLEAHAARRAELTGGASDSPAQSFESFSGQLPPVLGEVAHTSKGRAGFEDEDFRGAPVGVRLFALEDPPPLVRRVSEVLDVRRAVGGLMLHRRADRCSNRAARRPSTGRSWDSRWVQ